MVGEDKEKEIVGMIRGCIKTVTCGKKLSRVGKNIASTTTTTTATATTTTAGLTSDLIKLAPVYTKLAYILGLRVSPSHRYNSFFRLGIVFVIAVIKNLNLAKNSSLK